VSAGGLVGGHDDNGGADDGFVVDYKGNPVDKALTGGWKSAALIAGTELAERVAVIGVSMNLMTYLTDGLHLSNAKAANIVTNFMGTLNLLAIVGGFSADAKLGRYRTIAASATVSAVGLSLLAASTALPGMRPPPCKPADGAAGCVAASSGQMALLYAALYTIALGAGGLKANVSGLGTDQFDGRDPREGRAEVHFFSRFYFGISLGSLLATTVLVYVQDNVGRGWGYGVSAAVMVVATAAFVAGTRRYRYRRPQGSPLTVIGRVLWAAWRNRKLPLPADPSELHGFHRAKVPHTDRLRFLDKGAILDANLASSEHPAVAVPTLTEVEEVKMVAKLLPIWSTCILFWTVYSQMNTFTIEQASRMDRRVGGGGFVVPAGSMSVFLFLAILLFTALNERLLVPLARRVTGRREGLTSLQRVGTGLVLSTIAMAVAALVEKKRRDASGGGAGVAISAFWLVPQFFLVGASEAFGYVGQLEFFIREAPERMKSMSTGLFLNTLSMGFFLSSLLVAAVDSATGGAWVRDNLDDGRLDLFYWMLAVLGVFNIVGFLCCASRHEYKREAPAAAATAITPTVELTEQPEEEDAVKVAVAVKMMHV
ncbi:Protein NRT1/ PTR FAMILY 6.4, partial [Dichanthelium oligosanthes]